MKISGRIVDFYRNQNLFDDKMLNYIENQIQYVDFYDDAENFHIGFGVRNNNFLSILEGFNVCIPYPVDALTTIYDVHEIAHAIVAYHHLNTPYKEDITLESLPFLYEKLFILDTHNPVYKETGLYLDSLYDENSKEAYKFAFFARPYLIEAYDKDFNHMERLSKKLVKKYYENNK